MKTSLLSFCFLMLFLTYAEAQVKNDDILMTIGNEPILTSKFKRVYQKNLDLVENNSQTNIDDYLERFIDYQLKVREARALGYDKEEGFKKELATYRNQLAKNYLTDNKVTEALVKEAYERSGTYIKASHVLVALPEQEQDTMQAYNKILELRERLINEGFETLRAKVHDGNTIYVEDLGYFNAFKMVYDFENIAYKTKLGEVSQPFRTQFGYHVVQVFDKKPSGGEVTVGHIMISRRQDNTGKDPEEHINTIYKQIQDGQDFEVLAKQFSEDSNTASKGGKLRPFKQGDIRLPKFENVAFSLTKDNPISKPFKTDFSWHILKLYDKKPFESFENLKRDIEKEVKRDSRSQYIDEALIDRLKQKYSLADLNPNLTYFEEILNEDFFQKQWELPKDFPKENQFLKIKLKEYSYDDFGQFLLKSQKRNHVIQSEAILAEKLYSEFLNQTVLEYHKSHLEEENEEFAFIIEEFEEGLLLFNIMQNKIWNIASTDSIGMKQFYEANKSNYIIKPKVKAIITSSGDATELQKAKKILTRKESIDDINLELTKKQITKVNVFNKTLSSNDVLYSEVSKIEKGISSIIQQDGVYYLLKIVEVLPQRAKTYQEAKGVVSSDYQKIVEQQWLKVLREKYNIDVNGEVLNQVKTELQLN